MSPDNIDIIRTLYRDYYDQSLDQLPDEWFKIVMAFLAEMDGIGDLVQSVAIRLERDVDGLRAFTFPEMSRWSDAHRSTLISAQRRLYKQSQLLEIVNRKACEECGKPGHLHKTMLGIGGKDRILCDACGERWRDEVEAAMDTAAAEQIWNKPKSRFPQYFKPELFAVPAIYADDVDDLFAEVTRISCGRHLIEIDILHNGTDIAASMRPVVDVDEITDEQKASLFDLVKSFGKDGSDAAR